MEQRPWRVGDVIRKLRLEAGGWKLEQLAAVAGMDKQVISRIELGKTKEPKTTTLRKIASAFGLSVRELEDMVPGADVRLEVSPEAALLAAAVRNMGRSKGRRRVTTGRRKS